MTDVTQIDARVREVSGIEPDKVFDLVASSFEPMVFRGLASNWPLVEMRERSIADVRDYLLRFYDGAPVTAFVSETDIGGRIFYSDGLEQINFRQIKTRLDDVFERIERCQDDAGSPTVYMGSAALSKVLPGLGDENSLPAGDLPASVRIWIGNRTTVAAHYDVLENIACVCAGRRRFTLFPPEQLPNLYVGPIDFTPAGQSISLVDLKNPDFEKYPRFAEALEHAQSALLEPGDAIFIPGMWWHHVEGLEPFNILINHWWRESPAYMGAPGDALLHAILSIRDLPTAQRNAWRLFFDHYVFEAGSETADHIPANRRGALGEIDDNTARQIRAMLRQKLNR